MEELYFLGLEDLDRPIHKIDNETLFNCSPFYNDYYVVLYLKKARDKYKPILVNDRDLVINYGGRNFPELIFQVIASAEQIRSYTYKIIYRILVLRNGWWCVYIEKRYIWDCFESKGVITIMSPSKTAVIDFFQTHFAPKLEKRKPVIKRNLPVPQISRDASRGSLPRVGEQTDSNTTSIDDLF